MDKKPLRTQVKLLTVCLLAELAIFGLAKAVRLHIVAVAGELYRDLSLILIFWLACTLMVTNIVSLIGAVIAVVRRLEYRRFAAVSIPMTLITTILVAATLLFGGAQESAAVAFAAYLLAVAVYIFVPGKIWPPEEIQGGGKQ